MKQSQTKEPNWREKLHEIIYEADTPAGKAFDIVLLIVIVLSIIFVMIESIKGLDQWIYDLLFYAEWVVTILFTLEYVARIVVIRKPTRYIFSFYGIIDLLSTIPLYLSMFITGGAALFTIRALRLLRIFRILKINRYIGEGNKLMVALRDSRAKILVFLFAVVVLSLIFGTVMYIVEGAESGFTSIPISVYWCIVTLTTVGFGDIHPVTPLGQFIAAVIMIMGYGIIAVPTGIVSAEYSKISRKEILNNTQSCYNCNEKQHFNKANFCHKCGYKL
ncbi:ion transporter [Mesonia maritima]|uniref:Voltage-gated potassium channel n=1 Tax=Mesonia maritima TaxID=1793873 RepID=A0ABU1K4X8_9FLAO|nr:ion transporter [Mesonia maritima]MDR6300310.1 voltage-gated potassium channel [Mesonia maritima]